MATYVQTKVSQGTGASTNQIQDLVTYSSTLRELVKEGLIDEPAINTGITSAKSIFNGEQLFGLSQFEGNIRLGHEFRVDVEKDQNPFNLFKKTALSYNSDDTCHPRIENACSIPCVNTNPEFQSIKVRFDAEYTYGVRVCAKHEEFFTYDMFNKQFMKSKKAMEFGMEVDMWQKAVSSAITTPASTVDVKLAEVHATHYWANQGDVKTNGRKKIGQALRYMQNAYGSPNLKMAIPMEMAEEIIASTETSANAGFVDVFVNANEKYAIPGFKLAENVRKALGTDIEVVILERSPWLVTKSNTAIVSNYPLWKNDGTKQYAFIFDTRYAYNIQKEGFRLVINPYDCEKLQKGIIQTVYSAYGITFPQYALVVEFNAYNMA